jgi:hypothetical protein
MQNSFNSQELAFLSKLVDKACAERGSCDASTREMIASRLIARANQGEFQAIPIAVTGLGDKEGSDAK